MGDRLAWQLPWHFRRARETLDGLSTASLSRALQALECRVLGSSSLFLSQHHTGNGAPRVPIPGPLCTGRRRLCGP